MPKTTATDQHAAVDDLEAEIDEIVAAWDHAELQNKRARARDLIARRRFQQGIIARAGDIGFWEQDLARHGCRPVVAAWPGCPVPPVASGAFAPTWKAPELKRPRPVVYNSAFYTLDQQGVHLRQAGYWVSSPVFQTARPSLYAVEVDGTWRTVEVTPREVAKNSGAVIKALTAAGLRLNPDPVRLDANANAVNAPLGIRFEAWDRLAAFLDDHRRELPVRS